MAWNEPGKGKDPWGGGNRNKNDGGGPPDLDQIWKRLRARFGGQGGGQGNGEGNGGGGFGGGLVLGLIPVALVIWLATGLFVVQPGEKGVVLQFGRYTHTAGPGWHWHLPYPFGQGYKVDTQQVRRASNRAVMLTKDENIVDVEVSVQYRISNAMNYLFQLANPDQTVEQVLRSAVREIVGTSTMNQVIQEGVQVSQLGGKALSHVDLKENVSQPSKNKGLQNVNQKIASKVKKKLSQYPQITQRSRAKLPENVQRIMQYTLNKYHSGIKILAVNVQYAQPPEQVQGAFQEAIKAREQEDRAKNIARAYARDIVARAQGDKAQLIAQAKAYKQRKIYRAQGQAARFSDVLTQYQKAPKVTRERLYLESMGDVLSASHVVLDDGKGNTMNFLPLDKILKQATSQSSKHKGAGNPDTGSGTGGQQSGGGMALPAEPSPGSSGASGNGSSSGLDNLRSRSRNS